MTQAFFRNIEITLISNLRKASKEVKVAVAWFKNPVLFAILLERQSQGVSIDIIMADDESNFRDLQVNFQQLISLGGQISIIRYPRLMHHKFCIIDSRILITGSYNWTRRANDNIENVIISTDLLLVNDFLSEFSRLTDERELITEVAQTTFHKVISFTSSDISDIASDPAVTVEFIESPIPSLDSALGIMSEDIRLLLEQAETFYLQAKHKDTLILAKKIIELNPNLPEVYNLIAMTNWRQKDFKSVVMAAKKAVALNNKYYPAYNMLGIGYAGQGIANESLKNYAICLDYDPLNYIVHWNRAISYQDLQDASGIPSTLRNQFKRDFEAEINKTIDLTNQQENTQTSYRLYSTRGQAYLAQMKYRLAKNDLLKAQKLYNDSPKNEQDVHVLREIKSALKDIEWFLKQ